ncbi:MAG: hypothetical protein K0U37_09080 [Gammaproteobacteria bacterium]|nr:hypothetical protein [Gammaproteobacteria bacterium]
MTNSKLEAVYQPYDFEKKYKTTSPDIQVLVDEFDEKLLKCVDKLNESDTQNNLQLIAVYREQAVNLRRSTIVRYNERGYLLDNDREVLGRVIQSFDDLLADRFDDDNNYQISLLAREFEKEAKDFEFTATIYNFLAATCIVLAFSLAAFTYGISLLFLAPAFLLSWSGDDNSDLEYSTLATQKETISFAETSQGLFSSTSDKGGELNPLRQEDEHEDGSKHRKHE